MAGPALASILAQVTAIVILLHSINKSLQLGVRKIFPYRAVLKALIMAIIAGLPLLGIIRLECSDGIILVIGAGAFAVCYLPLAVLQGHPPRGSQLLERHHHWEDHAPSALAKPTQTPLLFVEKKNIEKGLASH